MQYKDEAEKVLKALRGRLAKFSLELSEEKTRIIEFGRFAGPNAKRNGREPETFNFLGFTHYVDTTRNGFFKVGRKTDRKKMAAKLKEMSLWLKNIRNRVPVREWWTILKAKLLGHFRYYGMSGNSRSIMNFYYRVRRLVFKWINRRSQKKCMDWAAFSLYEKRHELPRPRIYHNLYTPTGS